MTEKLNKSLTGAGTSVPNKMRLYATWVDRTPSNCIPRLCSLTFTRLTLLKPVCSDLQAVSIAVKMQSSKRTLRSNELPLPANGLLDQPLDVTFCLQYPHFLKREGNKLHILLQRRKRYKNRTMLGFKTLAEGVIRMDQVLQRPMDMELELVSDSGGGSAGGGGGGGGAGGGGYITSSTKDPKSPAGVANTATVVARLSIAQLSSTPIDHDHKVRLHDFSDDDDEISSGEEEAAELSDSEPIRPKLPRARRHNLKQRFVSLLRRFRVPDTEGGRAGDLDNPSDIQALFQELESLSCDEDSGAEQDTMSISSTPKPSLRPFFSSSRSLLDNSMLPYVEAERVEEKTCSGSDGNADLCYTDPEAQSDPQTTGSPPRDQPLPPGSGGSSQRKPAGDSEFSIIMQELSERKAKLFRSGGSSAKKKNSLSVGSEPAIEQITARKVFLEVVSRLLPLEENTLPECVVLISGPDSATLPLSSKLGAPYRVFQPISAVEVKALLTALFSKIHKYCNNCAKPGTFVKILLVGSDTLVGWFVRPYVELLSSKPSEWLSFTRVYIVPLGGCNISRQLSMFDQGYQSLFPCDQELKPEELAQRIHRYLQAPVSAPVVQMPVGEAMLTCHDENSQLFIPFINEVRVGPAEHPQSVSVDLDDPLISAMQQCSSPPSAPPPPPQLTPPSSPNVHARDAPWEPLELQIDYWQHQSALPGGALRHYADQVPLTPGVKEKDKEGGKQRQDGGKTSLKALFRGLQAQPTNTAGLAVTMHLASKEKKQKIMRLGKKKEKEKDTEPRCQLVEGVSRLICSARASHNSPMKIYIDGVEFGGVKFFQLSSTWQTHVKNLTIALAGVPLASSELS